MQIRSNITLMATISRNWKFQPDTRLWHMHEGLDYVKSIMQPGSSVVMGRHTFELLGGIIPKHLNIIVSKDESYRVEGGFVVDNPASAASSYKGGNYFMPLYILGGFKLHKYFIQRAKTLELFLMDYDVKQGGIDFFHLNNGWYEWRRNPIQLWDGRTGEHVTYRHFEEMV